MAARVSAMPQKLQPQISMVQIRADQRVRTLVVNLAVMKPECLFRPLKPALPLGL
jgi:hypothetical protein